LRKIFILLLLITSLLGTAFIPPAQTALQFSSISSEYEFGRYIDFKAVIQSASPLQSVDLFIRPAGESTRVVRLTPSPDGQIASRYDLVQYPLRPFSQVDYWFRVTTADGNTYSSVERSFYYEDNRFEWQTLNENGFQAAWQEGGLDFGQSILNVVQISWASVQMYLPAEPPIPLRVYVYSRAADLQSALQVTNTPWIAGHASPDLGVLLVSIPAGPDQRAEMERQIPHELMHIVEYQLAGPAYTRMPTWLVEGLASVAELYPNQDYERIMQNAIREDRLLPLVGLCGEFPRDLSGAILAYAQSASFVRFLHKNFGSSGLASLIAQYKDGYGCEEGVRAAFSETLVQLEARWKQEYLGLDIGATVWKNMRPYLLLLLVITLPVAVSFIPFRRRKEALP
jgi:hypothetical protein